MKDQDVAVPVNELCPNCSNILYGSFCFHCGQNQKELNRFFWSIVSETFEDIFSLDSRISLTLWHLLTKPGYISDQYTKGRRARYVPPLRLYIISSVIFALILSLLNMLGSQQAIEPSIYVGGSDNPAVDLGKPGPDKTNEEISASIESEVTGLTIPWLSPELNSKFRDIARQQARKAMQIARENPSRFFDVILDTLPPLMFVLLPVFALLLKLIFLSSGRYYTENLVLALHNHCFVYIAIILLQLFELITAPELLSYIVGWISLLLGIWIPIYLFVSIKIFYTQSLGATLIKSLFLSVSYAILLFFMLWVAIVWGFFTL